LLHDCVDAVMDRLPGELLTVRLGASLRSGAEPDILGGGEVGSRLKNWKTTDVVAAEGRALLIGEAVDMIPWIVTVP